MYLLLLSALVGCEADKASEPEESFVLFDEAGERPRNILMVSLDTTRRDSLSPETTPNLEALFERSLLLADHRSCSNWTFASVLCIQTGARGEELGFIPSTSEGAPDPAPDSLELASERLNRLGWRSELITANSYFSDDINLADGFGLVQHEDNRLAVETTDLGLEALARIQDGDEPWYLHLHYMDPHSPFNPPDAYRDALDALPPVDFNLDTTSGHNEMKTQWAELSSDEQALLVRHLQARYAGELAYVDTEIGRFLAEAEATGALDDTLLVFWTDHGEQLYDHGDLGHKYSLYEEENRAVVSFMAEGITPDRWEGPTTHEDLWPTIFAALDFEPLERFTGVPLGERAASSPRFALRHSGETSFQMVEQEGLKLLYWWTGEKELYRLADDPDEAHNLYSPLDPDVIALWSLLEPEVDRVHYLRPEYNPVNPGL